MEFRAILRLPQWLGSPTKLLFQFNYTDHPWPDWLGRLGFLCTLICGIIPMGFGAQSSLPESYWKEQEKPWRGIEHAIILRDETLINDRYSNHFRREHRRRLIKVFSPQAIQKFGTLKLLQTEHRSIRNFKAWVHLPTREVVTVSKEDVHKKVRFKEWGRSDIEFSIVFPQLCPGAIIEYTYEIQHKGLKGLYRWDIAHSVYSLHAELTVRTERESSWAYYAQNPAESPVVNQDRDEVTFIRTRVMPFYEEALSLPKEGLSDALFFYYLRRSNRPGNFWRDWGMEWYREFQPFLTPCDQSITIADAIRKAQFPDGMDYRNMDAILHAAYEYVRKNYVPLHTLSNEEFKRFEDDIEQVIAPDPPRDHLFESRTLTSFQMHCVFSALVKSLAPDASIKLGFYSPWNEHVFNPQVLSEDQLTQFLLNIQWQGEDIWVSMDQRVMPFGHVDYGAQMTPVLVVGRDDANFVHIPSSNFHDNHSHQDIHVTIIDLENAKVALHWELGIQKSFQFRSVLNHASQDQIRTIFESAMDQAYQGGASIDHFQITHLIDVNQPLIFDIHFKVPIDLQELDDHLLHTVIGLPAVPIPLSNSQSRHSAIVVPYPSLHTRSITYVLPNWLDYLPLPKDRIFNEDGISYSMRFRGLGSRELNVETSYAVEHQRYGAEKWSVFQRAHRFIQAAQAQNILFQER